jgi:AraC-like DNA-binding protein
MMFSQMEQPWKQLAPEFAEMQSNANLEAEGRLFHIRETKRPVTPMRRPHWHDSYELGLITRGQGVYVIGDQVHRFSTGQVYIVNTLEPHMNYPEGEDADIFVVHFHSMILDEGWIVRTRREARLPFVSDVALESPVLPLESQLNTDVRALLNAIRLEAAGKSPMWDVVVGGLLIQAVGLLARAAPQAEINQYAERRRRALRRISSSLKLIERHYTEGLTLERIAEAANLSVAHCCALFQEAVKMSPIAYRNSKRLTEAQRLLQMAEVSVQEIAYRVGFSSAQEFNRLFKRAFGQTPTQFTAANIRLNVPDRHVMLSKF